VIDAPDARSDALCVRSLQVNGQAPTRAWLSAEIVAHGAHLQFELAREPQHEWGNAPGDQPPAFLATAKD
jgi:putative alpha-1,2-mannosidase